MRIQAVEIDAVDVSPGDAEVESLAAGVRPLLADDAVWAVSEGAVPAGWFGRLVAGPVVGFLYRAFE